MTSITPTAGGATVTLDAAVTVRRSLAADVTEHPVEDGANISDHVRQKADELTVEATLVDQPDAGGGYLGRSEDLYSQLEAWFLAGELLSFSIRGEVWTNMVLTGLPRTDTVDAVDAVKFTITAKNIRIVSTSFIALAKSATTNNGKPKVDTGKQVGTPATTSEVRQSSAYSIYQGLTSPTQQAATLNQPLNQSVAPTFGSH